MSLGGMAIAIGALVDDAIIDVENVYKRLKQNAQKSLAERKNSLEVIFDASVEIRTSIINATFIIIVAFIPLFFLSGMEGKLLAPLGIAFIVSLFASLIVSITLTPVLGSYLLTNQKDAGEATWRKLGSKEITISLLSDARMGNEPKKIDTNNCCFSANPFINCYESAGKKFSSGI